jgi:hypothetical protein
MKKIAMLTEEQMAERTKKLKAKSETTKDFIQRVVMILSTHLSSEDLDRLGQLADGGVDVLNSDQFQKELKRRCPWVF